MRTRTTWGFSGGRKPSGGSAAARRVPVARASLVAVLVAFAMLLSAGTASAAVDRYCQSCFIYSNSYVINPRYHYNIGSYVRYLGTGSRWMGAGAWNYANFIWAWNEAYHSYSGSVNARAAAGFSGSQSGATSNAHASY